MAERLASFSDPMELLQHLLFYCPLAVSVLSGLQSIMFLASPLCLTILLRHILFGFSADDVVPRVFVDLLNVCKFCIWGACNDFRFRGVRPLAVDVVGRVKSRVRFISLCSSVGFGLTAGSTPRRSWCFGWPPFKVNHCV